MTSRPPHTNPTTHHPPSHYEILQIPPTATEEEIKQAYRSLVVRCHPDKNVATRYCDDATSSWRDGKDEHAWSLVDIDDDEHQSYAGDVNDVFTDNKERCSLERETNAHPSASEEDEEYFKSSLHTDSAQQQQQSNDYSNKFHQIQTAYNILRDANKRAAYDESLQRQKDREGWVNNGAMEVNLSEMERDVCYVVYTDNDESDAEREDFIQTVYFYKCRCGGTFEIVREELVEGLRMGRTIWQCASCSLAIRICVDVDIT
jgi:curved DNA-binding protein CbpA